MPGHEVDGHDFFAVNEVASEAIAHARSGCGPSLIHVMVNRYYNHFEGDAGTYRSATEVADVRENNDCLSNFRKRVTETALLDTTQLDDIDEEVTTLIDEAVADAKSAPRPTIDQILTDVYVSY